MGAMRINQPSDLANKPALNTNDYVEKARNSSGAFDALPQTAEAASSGAVIADFNPGTKSTFPDVNAESEAS